MPYDNKLFIQKLRQKCGEHNWDLAPDRQSWLNLADAISALEGTEAEFLSLCWQDPEHQRNSRKLWAYVSNKRTKCWTYDQAIIYLTKLLKKYLGEDRFKLEFSGCWKPDSNFRGGGTKEINPTPASPCVNTPPVPPQYLNASILNEMLDDAKHTPLYAWLCNWFDASRVDDRFSMYRLGGEVCECQGIGKFIVNVFPLIDRAGNVVDLKLMNYDPVSGSRKKAFPQMCYFWSGIHGIQRPPLPLFGAHLLDRYPNLPVGVVESEKSAIICSLLFPYFIWVATCGKDNLKSKLPELKGRDIRLFPDVKGLTSWTLTAKEYRQLGYQIVIEDEQIRPYFEHDPNNDVDIADIWIGIAPELPN